MSEREVDALDPIAAAREQRNIGPVTNRGIGFTYDAVLLVDRILYRLLQTTVAWFVANPDECRRYFSHFFDQTVSVEERETFVQNFLAFPPRVVLSYPRTGAQFPCYAIVMSSESESDSFLGDHVGADSEEGIEFTGEMFSAAFTVFVYAEHPDVTAYLYQLAKSIVSAGKKHLLASGVHSISMSGSELQPDEFYMPENMFVRQLKVSTTQQTSAPRVPAALQVQLGALFAEDVTVDGLRGGVYPYPPSKE